MKITVSTTVDAPVDTVWNTWTKPEHITQWCQASDDWHAPYAENDLRVGWKFITTMAARDGSAKFDFEWIYTDVTENKYIKYAIADGREVEVRFDEDGENTTITETFETEDMNSLELQKAWWQSILDSFKKYTESV